MISLSAAGPVRLQVDGKDPPPQLLWRKNVALLAYLALTPRGASRDQLVGLLWPDRDEAKARHSLNEALRVLRRSLGDALETEADQIRVRRGAVSVDPGDARGVFLEGLTLPDAPEFEQWVVAERERRRASTLETLSDDAEASLLRGDLRAARLAAERAWSVDPHDEPAARALMRALALAGARTRALAVFEQLTASLQRDLELQPDQETMALASRIKAGQVTGGLATSEPSEEPLPLLGTARDALRQLIETWSAVRQGARLVTLRGDPGTGKTRLLSDLAARARLAGAVVTRARALEEEPPEALWRALLTGGLEVPELSGAAPTALAGLAALDPDLALRFPTARGATGLPPSDAVAVALLAVADQKPVLVVLDDAHLASDRALQTLTSVVERSKRSPLLIALAAPRDPPHAALDRIEQRLGRDLVGARLETGPLVAGDVAALVRTIFPAYEPAAADRLARRVLADSGGNPFLAVELVSAVHSGLALEEAAPASWPAANRTLDQTLPGDLPGSVSAALRVRYRSLSAKAQTALAAVAVLGGTTPRPALARGAGLDQPALDAALDELEWQRWLTGDSMGYHFLTRLAREVVLADMVTGGQRHRMRERAGLEPA